MLATYMPGLLMEMVHQLELEWDGDQPTRMTHLYLYNVWIKVFLFLLVWQFVPTFPNCLTLTNFQCVVRLQQNVGQTWSEDYVKQSANQLQLLMLDLGTQVNYCFYFQSELNDIFRMWSCNERFWNDDSRTMWWTVWCWVCWRINYWGFMCWKWRFMLWLWVYELLHLLFWTDMHTFIFRRGHIRLLHGYKTKINKCPQYMRTFSIEIKTSVHHFIKLLLVEQFKHLGKK